MSAKVGIPRALLFYKYSPLWVNFFQNLGVEVVVSPETNKKILNDAIENCVDDACLPVKLYHGHVLSIKDQVDYLFIPRIMSVSKGRHICPKFCGLPEMIKYSLSNLPPILDVEINLPQGLQTKQAGKYFTDDPVRILSAYNNASLLFKANENKMQQELLDDRDSGKPKIMILGHPYNIYDSYVNMNLLEKIEMQGLKALTPEMFSDATTLPYAKTYEGKYLWTFAEKLIGVTKYLLAKGNIAGFIYLSSFGCGLDAVIGSTVERMVRLGSQIPFMFINLDEHTGEGGINTRIEAFIDLIYYKAKRIKSSLDSQSNIPKFRLS